MHVACGACELDVSNLICLKNKPAAHRPINDTVFMARIKEKITLSSAPSPEPGPGGPGVREGDNIVENVRYEPVVEAVGWLKEQALLATDTSERQNMTGRLDRILDTLRGIRVTSPPTPTRATKETNATRSNKENICQRIAACTKPRGHFGRCVGWRMHAKKAGKAKETGKAKNAGKVTARGKAQTVNAAYVQSLCHEKVVLAETEDLVQRQFKRVLVQWGFDVVRLDASVDEVASDRKAVMQAVEALHAQQMEDMDKEAQQMGGESGGEMLQGLLAAHVQQIDSLLSILERLNAWGFRVVRVRESPVGAAVDATGVVQAKVPARTERKRKRKHAPEVQEIEDIAKGNTCQRSDTCPKPRGHKGRCPVRNMEKEAEAAIKANAAKVRAMGICKKKGFCKREAGHRGQCSDMKRHAALARNKPTEEGWVQVMRNSFQYPIFTKAEIAERFALSKEEVECTSCSARSSDCWRIGGKDMLMPMCDDCGLWHIIFSEHRPEELWNTPVTDHVVERYKAESAKQGSVRGAKMTIGRVDSKDVEAAEVLNTMILGRESPGIEAVVPERSTNEPKPKPKSARKTSRAKDTRNASDRMDEAMAWCKRQAIECVRPKDMSLSGRNIVMSGIVDRIREVLGREVVDNDQIFRWALQWAKMAATLPADLDMSIITPWWVAVLDRISDALAQVHGKTDKPTANHRYHVQTSQSGMKPADTHVPRVSQGPSMSPDPASVLNLVGGDVAMIDVDNGNADSIDDAAPNPIGDSYDWRQTITKQNRENQVTVIYNQMALLSADEGGVASMTDEELVELAVRAEDISFERSTSYHQYMFDTHSLCLDAMNREYVRRKSQLDRCGPSEPEAGVLWPDPTPQRCVTRE